MVGWDRPPNEKQVFFSDPTLYLRFTDTILKTCTSFTTELSGVTIAILARFYNQGP